MRRRLKHGTLRRQIAQFFLESIMRGELQPGERIVEHKLSRELGVSQATVREALQELGRQGMVTKVDRRSTCVTALDLEEIEDAYDLRGRYEPLVAVSAIKKLMPHDFDQLKSFVAGMRKASSRKDIARYNQNDLAFHRLIWAASGRKGLERALNAIACPVFSFNTIELSRPRSAAEFDLAQDCDDHMALIRALMQGRPEEVQRVFVEKIEVFQRRFLESIQKVHAHQSQLKEQEPPEDMPRLANVPRGNISG